MTEKLFQEFSDKQWQARQISMFHWLQREERKKIDCVSIRQNPADTDIYVFMWSVTDSSSVNTETCQSSFSSTRY